MKRLGIDDKQLTPRNVLGRISWAKNHMLDPQEVYLDSADPKTERIAHIYEIYRQELAKSNALDFDDLLLYAVTRAEVVGRGARTLQPALSLHPGRRVSGHEPPAVRADAHAGRQRAQRLRGRRRRPEHLLVARRRHPQHPRIRAGLSRGAHHSPGAELPLDAEHPAGRVGGGRAATSSARARTCGPTAAAARRSAITKRRTARTKRCSPPITSRSICARRMPRTARRRARRCCIAPTRSRAW